MFLGGVGRLMRSLAGSSSLTPAEQLLGTEVSGLALDFVTNTYANRVVNGTDDPIYLFKGGEQGIMLDPSDITTLFQDAAGTTPLTNVEQPVGLALDRRLGLVPGPELVTNPGPFTVTTGWTGQTTVTLSVEGGLLKSVATGPADTGTWQSITTVADRWYMVEATLKASSGTLQIAAYNGAFSSLIAENKTFTVDGSLSTRRLYFKALGTQTRIIFSTGLGSNTYYASSVSVRELPGNHAFQTTSTARPILSARYNLLTYTEQFDDPVWAGAGSTITANSTSAPNGTQTADTLTRAATGAVEARRRYTTSQAALVEYTLSCYAKAGTAGARLNLRNIAVDDTATSGVVQFDLSAGTVSTTYGSTYSGKAFITSAGNGWWHCRITGTTAASLTGRNLIDIATSNGASAIGGTSGEFIYIWGADLRVANDGVNLPPYQRVGAAVNASTNPSVTGVPDYDTGPEWPRYLRVDGVDDGLSTGNINFTGTDKISTFIALRKFFDNANAVVELSDNYNTNAGSFITAIGNPSGSGASYTSASRGTAGATGTQFATSASTFTAPISSVVTSTHDISGDLTTMRVNGAASGSNGTADKGSGNFGNYPLNIGFRPGSNWFNGRIYGYIVIDRLASPVEIAAVEAWLNGKAKVYA